MSGTWKFSQQLNLGKDLEIANVHNSITSQRKSKGIQMRRQCARELFWLRVLT